MGSPRSPQVEAQVELPEEAPRALTGRSHYRVNSDSMLEELQQQLHQGAMAGASLAASERLDRIVPDPGTLSGSPSEAVQKTGTGVGPLPPDRPSMQTLRSAVNNVALGKLVANSQSNREVPLSEKPCIDRLCVILLLPAGVVLHGRPWWVATVRSAAVLVSIMQWAACLYPAATGGNTGWQMGSCLLHVSEATANLILLLQKTCSISFQEFNKYVKDAMQSQSMGQAPKSAIKRHILVITSCLASWMLCHVAKVRLVAMGGGQMTWQVAALPCLQCLYRAAWVLWLLRLNEFVNELVDAFCRSCASSPEDMDLAYIRWARVSAFTGQITQHCNAVYGVMGVTALMGGVAPIVEVFMSSSLSSQSTDWMPPQLIPSIMACWLMTYVFGSAAMVREKCKKAASLVNCLQGCLPGHARAEIGRLVSYMESSDSGIFFGGSRLDLPWYSRLRHLIFSAFLAVRYQTIPEAHKAQLAEQWGRFLRALAVWE